MSRLIALLLVAAVFAVVFDWLDSHQAIRHPSDEICGEVSEGGQPVAGALVRFKGRGEFTRTDALGRFHLSRLAGAGRVTAEKNGYFIAGASIDEAPIRLQLVRSPHVDCQQYAWVSPTPDAARPANCGNCHQEIFGEWQRSAHARSTTGKPFRDLYGDLLRDHPLGADVCSSCHAPTQRPGPFGSFDARESARGAAGLSGVHCDFCHKIRGPGTGEYGLTHGRHQLELARPDPAAGPKQMFFGPLDDVDRGEDVYSPFQRDSRLCAACHEGVVFGVAVYTTYSEWQASPAGAAGRGCTACHMAPTGTMTNIAPGHGGTRRDPATLGNHRFFGGSQAEMLRRCLRLETTVSRTSGGDIEFAVSLTANDVGHHVPTGFIDRQLILFVDAFAGKRALPAYQGPVLPEAIGAEEAGRAGRLYARVLADATGLRPARFWNADPDSLIDSRLRPGQPDRMAYRFPAAVDRIRLRVVHRRLWKTDAAERGWDTNEELIIQNEVPVP